MELLWLHLWTGTTASASDEVIVNGHWSKRVNGTTTRVMEGTDSTSTFAMNAGAGGAVAGVMLVWRVAMSSCSVWSQQTRPALGCSRVLESGKIERSVRQVERRVLSAHRWVRQRASRNRRTPQVTDHGLLSEHK